MKLQVTEEDWQEVLRHWKAMSEEGWESDEGPEASECAFCDKFYWNYSCEGCPIFEKTRYRCCSETPFDQVGDSLSLIYWNDNEENRLKYKNDCLIMYEWLLALYDENHNRK